MAVTAYVQLPFTTSPDDLADNAIEYLQSQWPGWEPDDADPAVIQIEALAPMAANAAQIAANMPPAALIALGTKLLGIPYQLGVSASASATFTVSGANGTYDIPAGSEIDLDDVAFQTTADLQVTITNGVSNTGTVTIAANDPGIVGNNLPAAGWSSVNLPIYVTGMTLAANTTGGVDAQDDTDYLNDIALQLQLRARSVITLIDFEIVAVNTAGIGRAVFVAQGAHPRNINGYVQDPSGNPVISTIKTALLNYLTSTSVRMVNAVITINDPAYTTVNVTYELLAKPGQDPVALQATCNAALSLELSPGGWGAPTGAVPGLSWIDQPVVHVNRLIGVLSAVNGVDYVKTLTLSASNVAQLPYAVSNAATGTTAITTLAVNALPNNVANLAVGTITDPTGAHTDTFTLSVAAAQGATSVTFTSHAFNFNYPVGSTIAFPLSTASAITTLGVSALVNALPAGTYTITDPTGAHTDTFVTTAAAAIAATSLTITSHTFNYAYPPGSAIAGAVTGDLTMNANAAGALPKVGTLTGTIDLPTT